MHDLITANLRSRPTRTAISILAVAIGVILMLVIGGITSGTLNDYLNRTTGLGADFILMPSDASVFYAFNTPTLPDKLGDKLKEVQGVAAVAPVLTQFSMRDFGLIFGIDLASYDQFPGRLQVLEGTKSLTGTQVIVDELYARRNKIVPGMSLEVVGSRFTVTGICRSGAGARQYIPLDTIQKINGSPGKVSMFLIKAAEGKSLSELEASLKKGFAGQKILSSYDASLLLQNTNVPGLKQFQIVVVLVSMLISFMVILLAMYTTIFERTREIGILKSLGASRAFIVSMILRESVIISLLGALIGTGISELIRKVVTSMFPMLMVTMSAGEIALGCCIGLVGGILGALYPAYKAAQMDPVKALTYE